mmetsp:Transcript_3270/g.5247  ORF Transcript_3270/g.5247 Transcript_3270/m.5247 type:complete len:223 (+) Transcript_3270:254-922(+)
MSGLRLAGRSHTGQRSACHGRLKMAGARRRRKRRGGRRRTRMTTQRCRGMAPRHWQLRTRVPMTCTRLGANTRRGSWHRSVLSGRQQQEVVHSRTHSRTHSLQISSEPSPTQGIRARPSTHRATSQLRSKELRDQDIVMAHTNHVSHTHTHTHNHFPRLEKFRAMPVKQQSSGNYGIQSECLRGWRGRPVMYRMKSSKVSAMVLLCSLFSSEVTFEKQWKIR